MITHIFTYEDWHTGTSFEVAFDIWKDKSYYPYQESSAEFISLEFSHPYNPLNKEPIQDRELEHRIVNYFEKFELQRIGAY